MKMYPLAGKGKRLFQARFDPFFLIAPMKARLMPENVESGTADQDRDATVSLQESPTEVQPVDHSGGPCNAENYMTVFHTEGRLHKMSVIVHAKRVTLI